MKLKHYHIFLFAGVCFLVAFIGINNKYDRFYRVAGMNNERRILIETYMDEAQQNYTADCSPLGCRLICWPGCFLL